MGITELKTFEIWCDLCNYRGPIIMEQYSPTLPKNWSYSHEHGYGGRTRVFCEECTRSMQEKSRVDAAKAMIEKLIP